MLGPAPSSEKISEWLLNGHLCQSFSVPPPDPFPALFCAWRLALPTVYPAPPLPVSWLSLAMEGPGGRPEGGKTERSARLVAALAVPITRFPALVAPSPPPAPPGCTAHPAASPGSLTPSPLCERSLHKTLFTGTTWFCWTPADTPAVLVIISALLGLGFLFLGRTPAPSFLSSLCLKAANQQTRH